jgi:hypothetical protein
MAQAKYSQISVQPRSGPSVRHRSYPWVPVVVACAALAAVIIGAASFTKPGAGAVSATHHFLEYYSGVFSLVSLSLAVMGGVAATDRIVLLVRHRVLLQAVHRATATVSIGFLAIHIAMKVLEGHAHLLDAVVPFMATHRTTYIGLGTIASYLMILVTWTGIVRGRFAETSFPWLWRLLHSGAYLCWPIALSHGLESGRRAAGWVTASYAICLILVSLALLVRLSATYGRRLRTPKATTTGSFRAIGRGATMSSHTTLARTLTPEPAVRRSAGDRPAKRPSEARPVTHPSQAERRPSAGRYADDLPPVRMSGDSPTAERPIVVPHPAAERRPPAAASSRTRARQAPPPRRSRRSMEDISDEEFWAHMRGETLR